MTSQILTPSDVAERLKLSRAEHYFAARCWHNWCAFEQNATGTDGLIYVAWSGLYMKFGFTRDAARLKRRLRDLRSLSPEPVRLMGATVGRIGIERWIHRELAPHRSQGEWYHICEPVIAMWGSVALAEPWSPVVIAEAA